MAAIQYWPSGAPSIGLCRCGGALMLVEDPGPRLPVEAQCAVCLEETGMPHDAVKVGAGVTPGSPEDFGF